MEGGSHGGKGRIIFLQDAKSIGWLERMNVKNPGKSTTEKYSVEFDYKRENDVIMFIC